MINPAVLLTLQPLIPISEGFLDLHITSVWWKAYSCFGQELILLRVKWYFQLFSLCERRGLNQILSSGIDFLLSREQQERTSIDLFLTVSFAVNAAPLSIK